MKQLESGFKRATNWNKYQSKLTDQARNRYLDYLIDASSQGVNKLLILSFENKDNRNVHTRQFLPNIEIKDYNVVIDRRNFFDWPIKNDKITYDDIIKIKKITDNGNWSRRLLHN